MIGFFKKLGKGLGYVLFVPLYLVVLALVALVGLVLLLILFVKSIFLFFTGRSMHDDLPEDKKAKEIIARSKGEVANNSNESPQAQETPTFRDMFIAPKQEEKTIEEVAFEQETPQEEHGSVLEEMFTNPEKIEKPKEEAIPEDESLERYTPLTNEENQKTFFTDIEIKEENDDD